MVATTKGVGETDQVVQVLGECSGGWSAAATTRADARIRPGGGASSRRACCIKSNEQPTKVASILIVVLAKDARRCDHRCAALESSASLWSSWRSGTKPMLLWTSRRVRERPRRCLGMSLPSACLLVDHLQQQQQQQGASVVIRRRPERRHVDCLCVLKFRREPWSAVESKNDRTWHKGGLV
jgi:hypothetical protein